MSFRRGRAINKYDIGIIGGADGPTSIIVSSSGLKWFEIAAIVLVAAAAAVIIIRAIIKHKKNR
ncbi:MAG: sodium ion-translocating decarboxylase subunit beta [Clostridiales bacterium]|nr:sodium ion-translocating decarboxylase subunit beta [Clostridiales bacterium]